MEESWTAGHMNVIACTSRVLATVDHYTESDNSGSEVEEHHDTASRLSTFETVQSSLREYRPFVCGLSQL